MGFEFSIRSAKPEDEQVIKMLVRTEKLNPLGLNWERFVVAVDADGRILGCVQLKPHNDGSVELASLVTLPEMRGRGVASALIEYIIHTNKTDIYLMCRSGLGEFYNKFGFRAIDLPDLPPYFHRILRLAKVMGVLLPDKEGLLVMFLKKT